MHSALDRRRKKVGVSQVAEMTPAEFKAARNALGLSQNDLAWVWGMGKNGGPTIRKCEAGSVPVNPSAAYCIEMMVGGADDGQ